MKRKVEIYLAEKYGEPKSRPHPTEGMYYYGTLLYVEYDSDDIIYIDILYI